LTKTREIVGWVEALYPTAD